MLTMEDTQLLESAGAHIQNLRKDNDALRACLRKARQELLVALRDADLYRERALVWERRARLAEAANKTLAKEES